MSIHAPLLVKKSRFIANYLTDIKYRLTLQIFRNEKSKPSKKF